MHTPCIQFQQRVGTSKDSNLPSSMILSAKSLPSLSGLAGSDESVDHCPSQATKRESTASEVNPESH